MGMSAAYKRLLESYTNLLDSSSADITQLRSQLQVCVCACVRMFVHACVCMCVCMCMYVCTCMCVYMCVHVCVCVCVHVCGQAS